MAKSLYLSLLGLLFFNLSHGQIVPKQNKILNYRLIGFSFPQLARAEQYKLQIADGHFTDDETFNKNISQSIDGKDTKIIAEVPHFGHKYTWRVVYFFDGSVVARSPLYHFGTGTLLDADTAVSRLRITKACAKYNDAYVFLDGSRTLYDMAGNPVWFVPETIGKGENGSKDIVDLKLSSRGTITFLSGGWPYEINYNGDILWTLPVSDTSKTSHTEICHHELTRVENGHYMSLGTENVQWELPRELGNRNIERKDTNDKYQSLAFGMITEFDEKGKIVWQWKSSGYFRKSDLAKKLTPDGRYDIEVHLNSFFFDDRKKMIYLNFRDLNRIVKVKYPEGNVVAVYGKEYTPGDVSFDNGMFCGVHGCKISMAGNIYLFNNNVCGTPSVPKLTIMKEPLAKDGRLTKIWEYECTLDSANTAGKPGLVFKKGGNIMELPDRALFASLNVPFSKLFIVSRDKQQELWSAVFEKRDAETGKWEPGYLYRASIIPGRREMEHLIWKSLKEFKLAQNDEQIWSAK